MTILINSVILLSDLSFSLSSTLYIFDFFFLKADKIVSFINSPIQYSLFLRTLLIIIYFLCWTQLIELRLKKWQILLLSKWILMKTTCHRRRVNFLTMEKPWQFVDVTILLVHQSILYLPQLATLDTT